MKNKLNLLIHSMNISHFTLHTQYERDEVIGVGVHICEQIWGKGTLSLKNYIEVMTQNTR